ncbi:MAG: alpha/beta hydrolase [Caldilineaceae bacterium]
MTTIRLSPRVEAVQNHGLGFWVGRSLLGLLALLVLLAIVGALYQVVATARDARAFPPPGQLVDVGGYKLHIVCTGPQNKDAPTVILDHVGAANAAQWGLVQPEIAKTTRVCAYDRAGFGWSERGPTPRDARQSMLELHSLLGKAGIPAPYVLVGHSYGANVARLYVAEYPDEVGGMVLVDPGHLFDTQGVSPAINTAWKTEDQTIMRLAPYLSRLGVMRLAAALGAVPAHGDLPASINAAYDALNLTTKFWDTLSDQNRAMAATSKQVLSTSPNLGALPLIVLSASLPADEGRQEWTKVNADLATRSSNGVHRVVERATHMSLALERQQAQTTIAAILQVVEAARTGQPLP